MTSIDKFPTHILKDLRYYVYLYIDPINENIFYVGKGKGNRVFSHLKETSEHEKVKYLAGLKENNLKPRIEILVHGLEDELTALRVETSIIDLLGIDNLTNFNKGYKSATFGRMTTEQLTSIYHRNMVKITEPSVLIRINKAFRHSMSEEDLYNYTRGFWKMTIDKANKVKFGFAVYQGIIQEVYEIEKWFSTNDIEPDFRLNDSDDLTKRKNRLYFVGKKASDEIRDKYYLKSVEHNFIRGNANPIKYLNI